MEVKANSNGGQPWFTREIAKLRKIAHGIEGEWLRCSDEVANKGKRRECAEKRREYKRQWVKLKVGLKIVEEMS